MIYDIIIGIEAHITLLTKSKLFCSCKSSFGSEPNANTCPVCLGHPGTMPNINKEAVDYTIMAGLATHCKISNKLIFDRKHYFYPDLPKGYQITQNQMTLCKDGYIKLSSGKKIGIDHIHLEEDAGKIIYRDNKILLDYNRSGVPLIEVVSKKDISSTEEACEYIEILKETIKNLGISSCKMHEGAMRCDVNVSVKKTGTQINPKVEIKNINSISFTKKALEYEINRQIKILESGNELSQETRHFNETTNETELMRKKENSSDYRYFMEPDLPIIDISDEKINALKAKSKI